MVNYYMFIFSYPMSGFLTEQEYINCDPSLKCIDFQRRLIKIIMFNNGGLQFKPTIAYIVS